VFSSLSRRALSSSLDLPEERRLAARRRAALFGADDTPQLFVQCAGNTVHPRFVDRCAWKSPRAADAEMQNAAARAMTLHAHGVRRNVSSQRVVAWGAFAAKALRGALKRSFGATLDSDFEIRGVSACAPSLQRPYWKRKR
jgi:hypothetical protein